MIKYYKTELISEFIKTNNLSITEFCKRCGISVASYKKIMAQKSNIDVMDLLRIATVMQKGVSEL